MQAEISERVHRCVEVEQAMAELYGIFAERFPEERDLWDNLQKEEFKHISFLVNMDIFEALGEESGQLPLPPEPFVERALQHARNAISQFSRRAVPLEEALGMALQMEDSVVESFVSSVMGSEEQRNPFITLLSDTRTHADMLRNLMRRKGFIKVS